MESLNWMSLLFLVLGEIYAWIAMLLGYAVISFSPLRPTLLSFPDHLANDVSDGIALLI